MRGNNRYISVRTKIILVAFLVVIVLSSVFFALSDVLFLKDYKEIERQEIQEDVSRVQDALQNELLQLGASAQDWATWDDAYTFIKDRNATFVQANLGVESIVNLDVDAAVFITMDGTITFQRSVDRTAHTEAVSDGLAEYVQAHPRVAPRGEASDITTGVYLMPSGPMLIASHPIRTSEDEGPVRGAVLFGKRLTSAYMAEIGDIAHLSVRLLSADDGSVPASLHGSYESLVVPVDTHTIVAYAPIVDGFGEAVAYMRIEEKRPIFNQGLDTLRLFGGIFTLHALVTALAIFLFADRFALSRLTRLSTEVEAIRRGVGSKRQVTEGSLDEIGSLARVMNAFVRETGSSRTSLERANARALAELREREKFKLAVDHANEHVVITDANGVVLYANEAAARTTGYPVKEMIGSKPSLWGRQMPPAFYKALWQTILVEKKNAVGEVTNRRKDGERYIAAYNISPILDERGEVAFFVALERDITNEKNARAAIEAEVLSKTKELREEQARFLASVNSLAIGFAIVDTKGVILQHNPALARMLRVDRPFAHIRDVSDRIPACKGQMEVAMKACIDHRTGYEHKDVSFENRFLHVSMTPVFADADREGEVIGAVLLVEDTTAARAIDQAKSEFVSLASHQLRTPLSTINWYVEMLLAGDAGKMNAEQRSFLDEIHTGSTRMASLVSALLDVSRLELGGFTMGHQQTDMKQAVADVWTDYAPRIKQNGVQVRTECAPSVFARLDAKYVRMVVQNLLSNAIKYTPDGGTVQVHVDLVSAGGAFGGRAFQTPVVGLSVEDTGYGIPLEAQGHIFEKMFRADNVREKIQDGTGLGLYIVKSIVDHAGGSVWFASEENKGTTFYVVLPAAPVSKTGSKRTLGRKK